MDGDADGWTDVVDGWLMGRRLDGAEAMDVGPASQLHDAGSLQIVLVSGQHSSFSCLSKHYTIHSRAPQSPLHHNNSCASPMGSYSKHKTRSKLCTNIPNFQL